MMKKGALAAIVAALILAGCGGGTATSSNPSSMPTQVPTSVPFFGDAPQSITTSPDTVAPTDVPHQIGVDIAITDPQDVCTFTLSRPGFVVFTYQLDRIFPHDVNAYYLDSAPGGVYTFSVTATGSAPCRVTGTLSWVKQG